MSHQFQNVHIYDTQLRNIFTPSHSYTIEHKEQMFDRLMSQLENPTSREMVQLIKNDMRKPNGGSNYDPANNIDSSELLADILTSNYTEVLSYLEEQLQDNNLLGRCPQGRSTRLIQIWRSLNSKTKVFKKNNAKVVIEKVGDIINLYSPHNQVNHQLKRLANQNLQTIIGTLRQSGFREFNYFLYKCEGKPDIGVNMLDNDIVEIENITTLFDPRCFPQIVDNLDNLHHYLTRQGYRYVKPEN